MRSCPYLVLSGVVICCLFNGSWLLAQPKPKSHPSESRFYRAAFPEKPETTKKELSTGGRIVTVITEKSHGGRDAAYAVTSTEFPGSYKGIAAKTILDGVREGMKGTDGKVSEDEELPATVYGHAGRRFRIEAGRNVIRARVFFVGTRLVQVMVTGDRSAVDQKPADEFFQSFRFVK